MPVGRRVAWNVHPVEPGAGGILGAAEVDLSDTITGKIIGGRYRITGFQRSGRMGDVFVGRRIDTDEIVSVKMLDPAMFDNTEAVKRFERETKITRRLDSPCTLVLNDYGRTEGGLPYMVLEYVEGEQLSDVIEAGRVAPERACKH